MYLLVRGKSSALFVRGLTPSFLNRYGVPRFAKIKDLTPFFAKLDEANSETKKLTALITDQTTKEDRAGEWEKVTKALEARLANQEKAEKDRKEREEKILRQNKVLKKALQEERSRGFFKKLFG
jgi:hypothetical protein